MSLIKVTVDRGRCMGTGVCVISAPEVFEQGDDCIAYVVEGGANEQQTEKIREAVASCPTGAISAIEVEDE